MIRTFLAIEVGEDLRGKLALVQQEVKQHVQKAVDQHARIQWVQSSNIHLTIKFLGDTDEQLIEPLREAMGNLATRHQAIYVPLERLGGFPRLQQPRVLWIGASEEWKRDDDAKRLAALHRAVEEGCRSFGLVPEERPLSPHLTLARIKDGERHVGQALAQSGATERPLTVGVLPIETIVLMKSELRPAGSVYTKLWEVRVGER